MSDIHELLDSAHQASSGASGYRGAVGSIGDLGDTYAGVSSYQDEIARITGNPNPYGDDSRIKQVLAQMSDPKAALDEWEAAKAYGRIYNISPYSIYGSSKLFSEDYFGHVVAPKTVPKAVADSFSAGIESMNGWVAASIYALDRIGHSQAGEALGQAFQMGLSGLAGPSVIQSQAQKDAALAIASGGPDAVIAPPAAPASPDMKKFLDYAIASMKKADELNEDIMPRSFGVQALKWTANTLPYMALIGAGSAVGAGLGAGAAGFAGRLGLSLAKRQVLRSVIAGGTSFATGLAAMQGQDFLSFLEAGMDEDTAAWLSLGTGALNAAIEQVVGLEGAVSSMFGKTGIPNLTNAIVKKVWVNGGVPSVIGRVGLRTAMSLITEPTEEGLQAIVSDTAQMLGQFLEDIPLTDKSMTVSKMAQDIAQNMWQALVTAPLLGLLPNTVQALKDTGKAKAWAAAAPSMPKAKAIELGKATGAFEGIPETDLDETLGDAYDRLRTTSTEVAIARGKAAQEKARELVAAGQKVDRTSSGGFRVEASSGEAAGLQEGEAMYTAGAANSDERYGDLVVRDSGDAFTIIDGDIAEDHEGDAVEIINEMAARLGGSKPLLLSDDVVDPVVIEAYNTVVASRGGDGTMGAAVRDSGTAEDVAAKERVRSGVRNLYQLEPEAADLVVGFLDMVASGQGKSFAEVARGLDEGSFNSSAEGDSKLARDESLGEIQVFGDRLKDGTVDAAKAIIYVAQTANFHTVMHEMAHYTRMFALNDASLSSLEAYYGVKDGAWSDSDEERFAEDLTSYLRDGKAPEPGLKAIFRKIAAMLRRFWEEGLSKATIDPELRKIFDSLFTKKEEDSADASGSVASEEVSSDEAVQTGGEISPQGEGTEAGRTSTAVGASGSSPVVLEVQSGSDGSLNLAEGPAKKAAEGKTLTDVEQAILDTAEIDAADQEEGFDGIDRSIGHIAFAKGEDGTTREIYRVASGDIYVAPVSNVIDIDTGNRIGSFAAKAHGLDAVLKIWGLPHKEGEQLTLFMKAEARPMEATDDMMEYDDFESWLRSVVVTKELSDADRAWFKRRWDYLHSGAERKFKKPGDFTRFLAAGSNLLDFMDGLYEAISTGAKNTVDRGRKERLSKTISKTPQLTKIMDEYRRRQNPSDKQKKNLLSYVRKNEALVKYLYGEVNGDESIADEALSDMKAVPELSKREFATSPELTLSDKRKILRDLGNLDIAKKVEANTATFEEMLEYTKLVEKTARSLVDNAEGKAKRTKARSKEREAKLKEYYRARDAARMVRNHMRRLRDFIMRAPGRGAMSYEHYQALAFIRDYLASSGDYAQMALKNLGTLAFTTNPELMQDTVAFLESFKGRPFEELTMAELSELAQRVKQIAADGRKEYKEAHLAYGLKAQAMRRKALEAIQGTKYQAEIHGEGTEEKKAQEQKMRLLHGVNFASIQPPQFIEKYMDGGSGGYNYNKLVKERVAAERRKWENYDRRTRPVVDFITKKKLHKELFKVVVIEGAGVMGQDLRMTVSELIGVRCLIGTKEKYNQAQREAYIYGNLFSDAEEKDPDGSKYKAEYAKAAAAAEDEGMLLNDYLKAHPIKRGDAWMESQFKGKLDKLLEATSSQKDGGLLTDDQLHLAELMLEATDNRSDFMRFAIAVKNLVNREPTKERYYFPIMRLGVLKDNEDEIVQMLKGGGFEAFQETGMTIDRTRKIQPKNQTSVKTDSMRIFFDAIIKQEHLTEMGRYAKEVRAIYMNPEFSKGIKEQLVANLGHGGYDYLRRYIDEITNPMAWKMKDPSGGVVGIARGFMVMSNLAYRLSSFLMQMATSPLPFFFEAPGEMMSVLAEAWTHNPVKWYKAIEDKSGNLKHRQFEPLQIVLEQLSEDGAFGLIKNLGQKGMNPLQFADRFSCAIGWEACYRKKMKELADNTVKTPQEKEEMAKNYADEVVKRTQPSAEDIDRSPLYRDMSAWKQIILQFTQPLNVIWNNVAYDAPMAWKEHHKGKAVGIITVYAMTGIIVGAVQALRTGGPGDGDDDGETGDDWLKFFLLAACGQFLEMIPLGGDYAVSVLSAAFNEGKMPFRSGQNLALLDEASKSVAAIFKPWGEMGDDERKKALQETGRHVITMTGLATGLPARAGLEYYDFIDRMVNGDE